MGNSTLGAITKTLTLIPFLIMLYYFDFPRFAGIFTPSLLAFFVVSVTLLVIGVILKAKILRAALQLSNVSFAWGALLLAFSVAAYLYGPYSPDMAWFRYESLFLLVISYIAFRFSTRVLRVTSPLLLIFAFSFAPLGLFRTAAEPWVGIAVMWVYVVAFLAYAKLRLRSVLLPGVVAWIGLEMWLITNRFQLGLPLYFYVLLPAPLLVLLLPKARAFLMLPNAKTAAECPGHTARADGFCSICGVRLSAPTSKENFGLWGLIAVAGVTALLLFASVPALAFDGGVPQDALYTSQGYTNSVIPITPSGWQVNSTTVQKLHGVDLYAVAMVYVPLVHPETKNYTVYYEVATGLPVSDAPNGSRIAGWNTTSNDFMQYGPFSGHLTTYAAPNLVMLSFQGRAQMTFLVSDIVQEYYVGLGFTRVFRNSNAKADASQFVKDIDTLWLPAVDGDAFDSTWVGFFGTAYGGAVLLTPLLLIVTSVGVMSWFSVQAYRRDERLDRFLTVSSVQSQSSWSTLSLLLARKNHYGTSLDLAMDEMRVQSRARVRSLSLVATLERLEQHQLVRRILVEAGSDILSVWRAAI